MRGRMMRPGLAAALLAAVAAGCAHDRIGGPGLEPVRQLTQEEQRVAETSVAFGIELLRTAHPLESEANLLLSPLSASMALGMAMTGAEGQTFDAMRIALGLGGLSEPQINAAYAGLLRQLRARGPDVEIGVANAAWHERTFLVRSDYAERLQQHFAARVEPLDFLDPSAPAVINAWVAARTGGRITDLIDVIDPLDRLILTNAVYFRGAWAAPFEPNATRSGDFTRADGSRAAVAMMSQDGAYRWFRAADAFGVELFYRDSAFSMVLVAPGDGHSLDGLIAGLTPARWHGWIDAMQTARVLLRVPKFRFEYRRSLNDDLAALGMGIAFIPRQADFTRIAPVEDLHISRVQQNTFIDVHELGTEAAAATAVVISITSMPPELSFDRPFLLAIRERESGTLLFLGRVGAP